MQPETTEDDLEVVRAEVEFAVQNCPVEGVLSTTNMEQVTFDDLQNLQARLDGLKGRQDWAAELSRKEILELCALVEYTVENCPVEGSATHADGRPILGSDVSSLAQKIEAIREERERTLQLVVATQ